MPPRCLLGSPQVRPQACAPKPRMGHPSCTATDSEGFAAQNSETAPSGPTSFRRRRWGPRSPAALRSPQSIVSFLRRETQGSLASKQSSLPSPDWRGLCSAPPPRAAGSGKEFASQASQGASDSGQNGNLAKGAPADPDTEDARAAPRAQAPAPSRPCIAPCRTEWEAAGAGRVGLLAGGQDALTPAPHTRKLAGTASVIAPPGSQNPNLAAHSAPGAGCGARSYR